MSFGAIDHVGIAVEDLDATIALYERTLGATMSHREVIPGQGVEVALLDVGESHVELIAPLDPGVPVARFLASRGAGLHHIAYRTTDIVGDLARLAAAGVRLIDEHPRPGARGSRVAFLHPASLGGVLTELTELRGH